MDAKDWRFPMACPVCKAAAGFPYCANTLQHELMLELRCRDCRHEWVISAPSPSTLVLRRKEDRRPESPPLSDAEGTPAPSFN